MNEHWPGSCFTGDVDRHVITPSRILYGLCAPGYLYRDNETVNASTSRGVYFFRARVFENVLFAKYKLADDVQLSMIFEESLFEM